MPRQPLPNSGAHRRRKRLIILTMGIHLVRMLLPSNSTFRHACQLSLHGFVRNATTKWEQSGLSNLGTTRSRQRDP
ncbi:hypothetical protein F4813DRAFT_376887 [Daldinia decipiens]|uniref:uncharacterized protein n=1 Tax=Daldinia decipiens TaxID=326647 RepID=UPI0020C38A48|nr:uncharacterized protein F4813DRAFT_376887 [Daldinia decipiens]KAI1652723.1 hypothetical protein F4813DRAFT_376887 [Daldinia decipiens]